MSAIRGNTYLLEVDSQDNALPKACQAVVSQEKHPWLALMVRGRCLVAKNLGSRVVRHAALAGQGGCCGFDGT